jgi:hypothetical protein
MANRDNPSGLKVARHARGGLVRPNRYFIASALASNIFRGDPVIPVNTSKRINVAAAGNRLIGVFQGVTYVNPQGEVKFEKYWPTGQTLQTGSVAEALVWDDPETLFEIQHSGVMAIADVGAFFDVTMATAGSTLTGISGAELDTATLSTADGQLRFEQIVDRPDNELGANGKALVVINEHYLRGALTGI